MHEMRTNGIIDKWNTMSDGIVAYSTLYDVEVLRLTFQIARTEKHCTQQYSQTVWRMVS